jgi:murein L,D-transpeptidase YcbB/YkuD
MAKLRRNDYSVAMVTNAHGRSTRAASRRCRIAVAASLALAAAGFAAPCAVADNTPATPDQVLRELLAAGAPPVTDVDAALGAAQLDALKQFYAARNDRPVWVDAAKPSPMAKALLDRLAQIGSALPPSLRPLVAGAVSRAGTIEPHALAELDLLLSATYGAAAIDSKNPAQVPGLAAATASLSQASDPAVALRETLPADPGFWRLRAAFDAYRKLAATGGWGTIPDGPKLQLSDTGARVDALRHRLLATDALDAAGPAVPPGAQFDPPLQQMLQHFQARHGLAADGVAGAKTIDALNVPAPQRLSTMLVNLQRMQHRDWGPRYIAVNIAAASYRMVEAGHTLFERPAVVGRQSWQTPTLDSIIDRLEFHPSWFIPTRIADEELWPKQDADPNYFDSQGIHILNDQLRQDPGPANPLGAVKFLFDNPYSVYLHDTSAPSLFASPDRFSSHGCVRVADAADLAKSLLAPDPQWPTPRIDAALQTGGTQRVTLADPMPLHIVYDTAWVDDAGIVQFRADIYHKDPVIPGPPMPVTPPAPPSLPSQPLAAAGSPPEPAGPCDG